MNIKDLHTQDKAVSAVSLFKGEVGSTTTIQLQENGLIKDHISKTPAVLICITGKVVYTDETHQIIELNAGDYVFIVADIAHRLVAQTDAQLILIK